MVLKTAKVFLCFRKETLKDSSQVFQSGVVPFNETVAPCKLWAPHLWFNDPMKLVAALNVSQTLNVSD